MARSFLLMNKNKINDPDVARQTLLDEVRAKETAFKTEFDNLMAKRKKAQDASDEDKQKNDYIGPDFYESQAVHRIEDYMHNLATDYRMGFLPKEYFLERLYQLNQLKNNLDLKQELPQFFLDNAEGHFEENKVIYNRMMGGYTHHHNPLTPEMLSMLPEDSREGYEAEKNPILKEEELDNNNEVPENEEEIDFLNIDDEEDEQVKDEDLKAIFGGPYDYMRALKIEYRNMTMEEANELSKDTDLYETTKKINALLNDTFVNFYNGIFANEEEKSAFNDALRNSGIDPNRPNELYATYMMWAMGEAGMSLEGAIASIEGNGPGAGIINDFKKFYMDNQVLNKVNDDEALKKAVKNQVLMLEKAMNQIKQFKFPNIDYMDFNAPKNKSIERYYKEFYTLITVGINANQDNIQKMLLLKDGEKEGINKIAVDAIGEDRYNEVVSFWRKLQTTVNEYSSAYADITKISDFENLNKVAYKDNLIAVLGRKKGFDYFFRKKMQKFRGKKIGEVTNVTPIARHAEYNAISDLIVIHDVTSDFPMDVIMDYATGKNPKPFEDALEEALPNVLKQEQQNRAVVFSGGYDSLIDKKPDMTNEVLEKFLYSPSKPEEALEFLKLKDAAGKSYKNYLMDFFGRFDGGETEKMVLGEMNAKVTDFFLIDGKSVKEIWGEKYKNIQNAEDREYLYRLELFKALIIQDRDIQVKVMEMGEDSKYKEKGYTTLLPSKGKLESIINNFNICKAQATELKNYLTNYQKVLDAHKETGKEYKNLMDNLKSIIKNLGKIENNSDVKIESICDDIKNLQKAINAFKATPESMDNPAHTANKLTAADIKEDYLNECSAVITDLVKGMKGDIIPGGTFGKNLKEPMAKNVASVAEKYNFTTAYHKSNIIKPEEIQDHLTAKKEEIRARSHYQAVKDKLAAKQNITIDEVLILNQNVKLYSTTELISDFEHKIGDMFIKPADDPKVIANLDILGKVPVNKQRGATIASVFIAWNMGYNNMSFSQAAQLLKSDKAKESIDAFFKFCEENPIHENPFPDKAKEAAIKWANIMKNATDRMKEYVIPDIDYNNPEEVKPYLEEIALMKGIGVDFVQEFCQKIAETEISAGVGSDGKIYGVSNSVDYMAEVYGGREAVCDMITFWRKIQNPFGLLENANNGKGDPRFLEEWSQGSHYYMNLSMFKSATFDIYAKKYLNKFKGKRIDDISDYDLNEQKIAFYETYQILPVYQEGVVARNPKVILDYLDGTNTKPLIDEVEGVIEPRIAENMKGQLIIGGVDELVSGMSLKAEDANALLATGDDPEAMLAYINTATGREYVNSRWGAIKYMYRSLLSYENINAAKGIGIDILDAIKINGHTPEELWGNKYNNFSKADKQRCLMTEIVKAGLMGENEITIQAALMEKGAFKPGKVYTVVPKKTEIQKAKEGIDLFPTLRDKILLQITDYTNRLLETQTDKNANFRSAAREGSEPYRNMCRALANCRALMQHINGNEFSMPRFQRRLKEFQEAAEIYYKRGKTSNQERMNVAREASKEVRAYVEMLDDIIKVCDKNLFLNYGQEKFIDASFNKVQEEIIKLGNIYAHFAPLPQANVEQIPAKVTGILDLKKAQHEYKVKLEETLGGLPDTSKKLSTEDVAKLVMFNQFMSKVKAEGMTAADVNERKELIDKDILKDSVSDLGKNKVFQIIAKKYQDKAPAKWEETVKKAADIVEEYQAFLTSLEKKDIAEYVMPETFRLSAKKDLKAKDKYETLGDIIAKQIITNYRNEFIPLAMAAGLVEYKDILNACTECLRKDEVLDHGANALSKVDLNTKVKNGTLKNEVLTKISATFGRQMEQKAKQQAAPERQAAQNGPRR